MMTFSERYGIAPKKALQINSMDEELRTSLWICLEKVFEKLSRDSREFHSQSGHYRECLECIWTEHFKRPKSQLIGSNDYHIVHSHIKPLYEQASWDKVYSLIEFVTRLLTFASPSKVNGFKEDCNYVLERESAAWRIVNDEIVPITEPREIQCIEDGIIGVGKETALHLAEALKFLSQRGEKEYRACGRAAIDALEAYTQEVSDEEGKTISEICKNRKLPLHPALQKSIQHLYDYASDQFRHAIKPGDEEITYEDAKNMLLQCTSLINLLKSKRQE